MIKSMKTNKNITLLFFILLTLSLSACGNDHREYNHDGSLKSIGEILPDGRKDGDWQTFYRSGSPMSKGVYNKGEKEGRWTYWNKDGDIVARKNFKNGIEISEAEKEAAPKITKKRTAQPTPKLEHTPEATPKREHKAAIEPETAATDEPKTTEPYVENSSGFAATMEEWKAMKKRKKEMPEVEAPAETSTEEAKAKPVEPAPEPTPEPVHEPSPTHEQEVEISEPVQTAPVQEVVVQPITKITEPVEEEVEITKEQAPVVKKKPVTSSGKFWRN